MGNGLVREWGEKGMGEERNEGMWGGGMGEWRSGNLRYGLTSNSLGK